MRISIIGAGYVGLATAVGLAGENNNIVCVDNDLAKVTMINKGKSPFFEDALEKRLARNVNGSGCMRATDDYLDLLDSEIIFICVGTPSQPNGSINLEYLKESAKSLGRVLASGNSNPVIVLKSTVVPGTTESQLIPILEKVSGKKAGKDFSVAFNPEFLQEGKALQNFENPDKIVVGEYDSRAGDVLQQIFTKFEKPIIRTNIKTAEIIKYASNAFLATKISFINEIGNICKMYGIDVYKVADAIGQDPRIGRSFLNAGIGFGGSCLPKDVLALICSAEKTGYVPHLLRSVFQVNNDQPKMFVELVKNRLNGLAGKTIAVLGLAFKPNTDDVRHASSIAIVKLLCKKGATVKAYDPLVKAHGLFISGVTECSSAPEAISNSDCVLILTEWEEFKNISLYKDKTIIDGRRILDPDEAKNVCALYEGICW